MLSLTPRNLIIIDMQYGFLTSHTGKTLLGDRVSKICKLIEQWKLLGWPIILVEYARYGPTLDRIQQSLDNYDNQKQLTKRQNNGADEIFKCVHKYKLPKRHLVTGVNTNYCVAETVIGLSDIGHECLLVRKAVATFEKWRCPLGQYKNKPFGWINDVPNVSLVNNYRLLPQASREA